MVTVDYLRTSTEEQKPENQLEACKTLHEPGEQYEVIIEQQSAFKDKDRPKFEEIKKRIKAGEIDKLICWDWDRLFRNQKKLVDFFRFCELYKCKIYSYNQRYFDDFYKIPAPFDEIVSNLVLNLMGWLAEEESKKKGERVKLAVRRRDGKPTKSYKGNKWGRKKQISKRVVDEVIRLKTEMHMSIREIAASTFYTDKNNHRKNLSVAGVHKILKDNGLTHS